MKRSLLLEAVFALYRNCVEIGYTLSLAWGLCFQNKLRITMPHIYCARVEGCSKGRIFQWMCLFFSEKISPRATKRNLLLEESS